MPALLKMRGWKEGLHLLYNIDNNQYCMNFLKPQILNQFVEILNYLANKILRFSMWETWLLLYY